VSVYKKESEVQMKALTSKHIKVEYQKKEKEAAIVFLVFTAHALTTEAL